MSSFGFEIKNSNGQVVASTDYPVYTPVAEGTVTVGGNAIVSFVDIPFSSPVPISSMPIFAFVPHDLYPICVWSYLSSGSSITGVRIHAYAASQTNSVQWQMDYVVAVPVSYASIPSEAYGIEVRSSDGKLTFHSGKDLMTIKGSVAGAVLSFTQPPVQVPHSPILGKRYVAVSCSGGFLVTKPDYVTNTAGVLFLAGVRGSTFTPSSVIYTISPYGINDNVFHQNYALTVPTTVMVLERGK